MIEIEDRGDVRIIRMARGKGNALNLDLLAALIHALINSKPARPALGS